MQPSTKTSFATCAALAALFVAGLPAGTAGGAPTKKPAIGDACLIGTWHDNPGRTTTTWNSQKVKMHYRGGDIDHISASGLDSDNWRHAKKAVGTAQGYKLVQQISGVNHLKFKVIRHGVLRTTELGWAKHSKNIYHYQGQRYVGYLTQSGHHKQYYSCTAHTLSWKTKKGKVLETETRRSKKP
jgi:hypothetical protein